MVKRNMVPAQLALSTVIVLWATISFHGVYRDCAVSHHLILWCVQRLCCEPPSHLHVYSDRSVSHHFIPWCVKRLCCEPPSHLHVYSDHALSHHLRGVYSDHAVSHLSDVYVQWSCYKPPPFNWLLMIKKSFFVAVSLYLRPVDCDGIVLSLTHPSIHRAQELCESRGGCPGLPSLISLRFLWT